MAELDALLSQPAHGAIQVMQLDALGPLDVEILFPPFCGAVASGIQQAVEHGEEDRPFHGKAPPSISYLALDCLRDSQLVPESIKDKGGTDGQGAVSLDGALSVGIDDGSNRGELRQRTGKVIDLAR